MSKNFNRKKYLISGIIFAIGFFFLPVAATAATTLYFDLEKPVIYAGDTFLIHLEISTPDKLINVVEGTILYDNSRMEIKEVSIGGSLLNLWPKPPVFSNDKGTLSFVGGVLGGFQGKKGEVLKIIFLAKSEGEAKIDFLDGFSVFLNDGQGTPINPWLRPFSLDISKRPAEIPAKDEWQALVEKDKTSPEFVEAIINRDTHLFNNQYFVSFFAMDKDSGISHYEVKEGDDDFVRAESPHLLQDQSLKGIVQIKAVDKAGNESAITPESAPIPGIPYGTYLIRGLIMLAVLTLVFWLWRLWRRGWKFALFLGFFTFLIFSARAANAATLYLSPSSGNFTVGNILTVNILVNTENVAINNTEATLNFPAGLLEIVSISKSGSIFSLWVEEPTFSNGIGALSFNGGLPTPGFNGTAGKVAGVVFRVKKAGSASLIFSAATVRANDGHGTDVFGAGTQAIYNLISEEKASPTPDISGVAPRIPGPAIVSDTHPDQARWYSNAAPHFSWPVPSGVLGVDLVLGTSARSVPQVRYSPAIGEKTLPDVADGVWYLNARFRTSAGLGPISSFRFNVDTKPPRALTVTRVDTDNPTDPQPRIAFDATDDVSGIDRYEMKIDDGDWERIAHVTVYTLPPQPLGSHVLTIRAVDRAGNTTTAAPMTFISVPLLERPVPQGRFYAIVVENWRLITMPALFVVLIFAVLIAIRWQTRRIGSFAVYLREYQLYNKLGHMSEDIGKELKLLGQMAKHRPLYPDEQYLRMKLSQYRKTIAPFIARHTRARMVKKK